MGDRLAERDTAPLGSSVNGSTFEVRAKALECAVRYLACALPHMTTEVATVTRTLEVANVFEAYLRGDQYG